MVGGRPKPSPCLKLFSFLYPKNLLPAKITLDDRTETYEAKTFDQTVDPKVEAVTKTSPENIPNFNHS